MCIGRTEVPSCERLLCSVFVQSFLHVAAGESGSLQRSHFACGGRWRQCSYDDHVHAHTRQLEVRRPGFGWTVAFDHQGAFRRAIEDHEVGDVLPVVMGVLEHLPDALGDVGDAAVVQLAVQDDRVFAVELTDQVGLSGRGARLRVSYIVGVLEQELLQVVVVQLLSGRSPLQELRVQGDAVEPLGEVDVAAQREETLLRYCRRSVSHLNSGVKASCGEPLFFVPDRL